MNANQTFDELCKEITSPQAVAKRIAAAEAALKKWNDPHEAEMRRLYTEAEREQLRVDAYDDEKPWIGEPDDLTEYYFDTTLFKYVRL